MLNTIEGRIYTDILEQAEGFDKEFLPFREGEEERELMVPVPFTDVYLYYLAAMIDFYNGDSGRYNDTMVLLQSGMGRLCSTLQGAAQAEANKPYGDDSKEVAVMKLPRLSGTRPTEDIMISFKGYNCTEQAGKGRICRHGEHDGGERFPS